jgi:hypothetical protein
LVVNKGFGKDFPGRLGRALAEEARVYLAWLADNDSCRDMPEDWEPA